MKTWLLRISVILSLLTVLLVGGWWIWKSFYSNDALTIAVGKSDIEQVNQLLSWGAQVNGRNSFGTTVLHMAAAQGNARISHCLIEAGANVNAYDEAGATPLDRAELFGWVARAGEEMAKATPFLREDGPLGPSLGSESDAYNDVRFALLGGSVVDGADYEKVIKILKDSGATSHNNWPNTTSPQSSAKAEAPFTPKQVATPDTSLAKPLGRWPDNDDRGLKYCVPNPVIHEQL